jgi:hypothetical protein
MENKFQISLPHSLVAYSCFSTPPIGVLAVVCWASVLRSVVECLLVRSSIQSVKHVWF